MPYYFRKTFNNEQGENAIINCLKDPILEDYVTMDCALKFDYKEYTDLIENETNSARKMMLNDRLVILKQIIKGTLVQELPPINYKG